MSKANYTNSNVNDLPEGVNYSKISNKWVARVKCEKLHKVISIGQDKDKSVAEKILQNYLDNKK